MQPTLKYSSQANNNSGLKELKPTKNNNPERLATFGTVKYLAALLH